MSEPGTAVNVPGRALAAAALRRRQRTFVWQLRVTTEVALRGGVDVYNFPKFIADIEFSEAGAAWRCRLAEGREPILTLTGGAIATPGAQRIDHLLPLWMDGEPQSAHCCVNQLELGVRRGRAPATLKLGDRHPIARQMDRLLLARTALHYERCPRFEAILFGPGHLTLPLVHRGLQAVEALAPQRA